MNEEAGKETTYETADTNLIIHVSGDLDHHNAEGIRLQADRLIEVYGIQNVIFDFSEANFMDSSGIGVIMGRYRKVKYLGGKVSVCGIGQSLGRVFEMSGLYKIVSRYQDVWDALPESFRKSVTK